MDDSPSNLLLLERARAGDRQAIEALLERHQAQIYRFGMKMCRDPRGRPGRPGDARLVELAEAVEQKLARTLARLE